MKKITPYLVIFSLILVLSGAVFILAQTTKKSDQGGASLFTGIPKDSSSFFFTDHNNGDGTCWRGTYENDGTPIAIYYGTWAAGTDECRLGIPAPTNTSRPILSTNGTTTSITVNEGADYFTSPVGITLLQLQLNNSGLLSQEQVTGRFTPETFLAIRAFQVKKNLPVTGYPNAATIKSLNAITFTTTGTRTLPSSPVTPRR